MVEPAGYVVTLKDVHDGLTAEIRALTGEVNRMSGQLTQIESSVTANTLARADHETWLRRIQSTLDQGIGGRDTLSRVLASLAAVAAVVAGLSGWLTSVHH